MKVRFATPESEFLTGSAFTSGLLVGALLGVAAGILIAPRSGKDTRKKIAGAVGEHTEELAEKWDETKANAREAAGNLKADAETAAGKAKDKLDDYKKEAGQKASELSDKAEDKAGDLADDAKSAVDTAKDTLKNN